MMKAKNSPPPPPQRLWLRVLYAFYEAIPASPITPRELFESIHIGESEISYDSLRMAISKIWSMDSLYRFGNVAWQGYSYMINLNGLTKLRYYGLISKGEEEYARGIVLGKLEEIDPQRYERIINIINRRRLR